MNAPCCSGAALGATRSGSHHRMERGQLSIFQMLFARELHQVCCAGARREPIRWRPGRERAAVAGDERGAWCLMAWRP
jgi:hypothetical protein